MNRTNVGWDGVFPEPFFTVNPFIGCSKVSEGCKNCYAERMACRLASMEGKTGAAYLNVVNFDIEQGCDGILKANCHGWNGRTYFLPDRLDAVRKYKGGGTIFWCSMSDMFHENNSFEDIEKIWDITYFQRDITHVILTKRPDALSDFTLWAQLQHDPEDGVWQPNVYLGVTAENQARADERIPILLSIPGNHKRFVSVEPMLGQIELDDIWRSYENSAPPFDLVIIGPENGPNKRECKAVWIFYLQLQCYLAGVPCFLKEGARKAVEE